MTRFFAGCTFFFGRALVPVKSAEAFALLNVEVITFHDRLTVIGGASGTFDGSNCGAGKSESSDNPSVKK